MQKRKKKLTKEELKKNKRGKHNCELNSNVKDSNSSRCLNIPYIGTNNPFLLCNARHETSTA